MRSFQIVEAAKDVPLVNQIGKEYFIENENCRLAFYVDEVVFVELKNAMRPGRTCERIQVTFENSNFHGDGPGTYIDMLNRLKIDNAAQLISIIRNDLYELEKYRGLYVAEKKASKVFSPFVKVKPISKPNSWTKAHVWKALLAGQIHDAQYDYYYTDDYADDSANNFRKGRPVDCMELARELIETSSSGYSVYERTDKSTPEETLLSLHLHGFDCKSLTFVNCTAKVVA